MKHNLLKSVIISVILLMGVSNAWGATIDNISDVWMEGSMNSWENKPTNWKFSKAASNDNNHYIGTFYIPYSSTKYEFKIRCAGSSWTDGSLFAIGGYWFTSDNYDFNKNMPNKDVGNDLIECISTSSGYIKLDCEFWGNYNSNSRLVIKQSAVAALSPSLSASTGNTPLIKSGKSTITASCSGGSGSYTYTYKVTCDGNDVTNSTLNTTSGSSVTFTAPSVTGKKTYTIIVTAKDSHALLSGLATQTAEKTITVEEAHNVTVSYKYGSTTITANTTTSNVKYETASSITAPAITGYKFSSWTLGNGITNKSANTTANPISITTKSSGTYTLTANYTEDLTSNWKLIGDNQTNSPFGDNYTYSSGKAMTKKSGHSTESNVYITLDIKHLPASYYGFKVATSNSDNDKYGYGTGAGHYIEFNRSASNSEKQVYSGSQHELKFIPDALGEYEFRVNYPSGKYVYVTFPTAYVVTFGKGTGGNSVTAKYNSTSFSSETKVQFGKTVTFTQIPSAGYAFKEWNTKSDGTGTTLSTNETYTHTVAETNTVYAIYTKKPDNIIYLKPSHSWKSNNAQFAVKYDGTNHMMIEVEECCEEKYYKVTIPSQYSKFNFVRLSDNGSEEWNVTGEISVPTDGKNLYDMTKIYLKPNANWKSDGARFAAYFFVSGYTDSKKKWMSMLSTDEDGVFYCDFPTEHTFDRVSLTRMNGAESYNDWAYRLNQTKDIDLFQGYNSYELEEGKWGKDNSDPQKDDEMNVIYKCKWTTYNPTYSVTLEPTAYGYYTVEYNGRTYKSATDKNVVIHHVPLGATIRVSKGTPDNSAEYTGDMLLQKASGYGNIIELKGQEYYDHTICGNTTIDENFVTKNPHVVYLRIPDDLDLAWGTGNDQKLSVYNKLTESYTPTAMTAANGNYEPGYTYYTYTIPAGTHTIRFEYNNQYQTHDFPHVMPLGSLNCYTIQSREGETSIFNGYWSELLSKDDYRLLYVEQVVEKDKNNKTVITRKKAHPSNIIKKRTETGTDTVIVSLHVYNQNTYKATYKWENEEPSLTYDSPSNSAVILQQYDGSKWVDIQHHMVFGPLEAHVYTAMLPGRRNATAEDEPLVAQLKADYGIKAIINDTDEDKGNGVWNFPIQQTVDGGNTTVELMREGVRRYEGDYYIRTDVANGGWFNYNPTNHMTRSDEAKANSNFSHYYCKWVKSNNDVNVKFTVANDYGYAISDTLEADRTDLWGVALTQDNDEKMVDSSQKLPTDANVRFAWNEYSNFIHRAYIAGSAEVSDRFLVLEGDANIFDATGSALDVSGLKANEQIFRDNSNWIYYADVQMKPMAPVKVTAKYDGHTQYFIGKQDQTVTLLQGTGEEKYLIRMLYDFKTNQLISAYVPGASDKVNAISTNLMLIRQNNNKATQLIFNNETPHDMETIPTDRRAYGVIEFTEKRLIQGKDDEDKSLNDYEKSLYWISFPFNVDVSKAISFGEYGKHWIIQEYNGARRAAEGMWLDSETFWDYKWDQNITLEAGKGYVLALDVDQIKSDGLFGLAGNRPIGIYFPSTEYISTAITEQTQVSTTVPAHECTINRATPKGDRRIADSHWNVIGVPSYVNAKGDYQLADIETQPKEVKYYYRWDGDFNAYTAMEKEGTKDFQSTYAYMVQFAGQINWQNIFNVNGAPKELAAKQSTDSEQEHRLRLELHQKDNKADHTFVRLQDEDGVTNRFDFNHDLCKVINAGANIYSIITAEESPVEVAANVLPINETIIPVGVKITAAGEYTFAMPEGTDGIVVELIDYETNTTTNLLLDNYTVNLGKGTFDNRFALHIKPNKTATGVDNIGNETTSDTVKKYLIDGILYMQKDGVLYDAQGKLVR